MELYIHIPFCVKKCRYCDFLSFPKQAEGIVKEYIDALCRELEVISGLPHFRNLKTCFIGGGTPSCITSYEFEKILRCVKENFSFEKDYEYSIECNPGTLTEQKLEMYREYGINRLSLGLQSDNDQRLKSLGRIHNYADFLESYVMARRAGFRNINIDLMSAIPDQTLQEWKHTLENICKLQPEHISAYSLIIEPGTPLYEQYNVDPEALRLPDEEEEREMYHVTETILAEYGYHRYEISNYALKGMECRHNLGYWTGEPYYGAGLGASSYLPEEVYNELNREKLSEQTGETSTEGLKDKNRMVRFKNTSQMREYLRKYVLDKTEELYVGMKPDGIEPLQREAVEENYTETEYLDKADMMSEYCILGLRTCRGISEAEFLNRFGENLYDTFGTILEKYLKNGFLAKEGDRIYFTSKGFDVSNTILCEFM